MQRYPDMQAEAAEAHARELEAERERLDDQGLCHDCGESPQNPHLPANLCLSCFNQVDYIGCSKDGCPLTAEKNYLGQQLCKVHIADLAADLHGQRSIDESDNKIDQAQAEMADDLLRSLINQDTELFHSNYEVDL